MAVDLVELTAETTSSVVALQLAPGQGRFVTSVADSLEEAGRHPEGNPWCRAVHVDGREVVQRVAELEREHGGTEGRTSHVVGDGGPAGSCERLGFVPRGDLDPDGEVVLRLDLVR